MTAVRRALAVAALLTAVGVGAFAADAAALWSRGAALPGNAFTSDTLDPPTALAAVGGLTVTLTWTPTLDAYATGYRILRRSSPESTFTTIATVTPRTATLHVDDPPLAGTYVYAVEAFSGAWTSARSNEATAVAL